MTVLLYDYCELEERAAKHLKTWKVWHLILYSLAAIFGVTNYVILQNTMQLVDNHCVLYPRELEFRVMPRPNSTLLETNINYTLEEDESVTENQSNDATTETIAQDAASGEVVTEKNVTKREIPENETMNTFETMEAGNVTVISGNQSHQMILDTSRSLFALDTECQFPEYMPVMATVCALLWITLFTMCPGGGRPRSGLQQPWRILTPALLFALVLVALTGHSFARTNAGLQAFCAAFAHLTNSSKCSSVNPYLEGSWRTSWSFGARASALRAASAGAFAAWAAAAALLLARCLAAPDFVVKHTEVFLKDPHGKLTPHLKKGRRQQRSPVSSPGKRDNTSVGSEPTFTTELATASVERGQDSVPTSLLATPVRKECEEGIPSLMDTPVRRDREDLIEMTYTPQDRRQ